ncbi:MAG: hypothetical protein ABIJ34_03405 [archaeon]
MAKQKTQKRVVHKEEEESCCAGHHAHCEKAVSVGYALGLTNALCLAFFALSAMTVGYGVAWVRLLGSIYLGYEASWAGLFFGLFWGFVKGFLAGFVFMKIFSHFGCCRK